MAVKVKEGKKPTKIITNNIVIRQTRRTSQDIGKWRNAIQQAENVMYPRRIALYDLYSDILLDGHLSALIDKRINAIINSPIVFMRNGEIDEKITALTQSENFIYTISEILLAKFWGHTLLELTDISKFNFELIPRKHVVPEKKWIIKEQTDTTPLLEYNKPPYNNYLLEAGKRNDLGLLMKAAQYVIYKRGGFGDWAQFAEIFGMPFRKGTYDGVDDKNRIELENALKEAGSAAYAVIPEGSDIEFIASSNTGNNNVYSGLIQACNAELSKLILGNTLTTEQGDKGARSLGEVHQDVENGIHESDKMFVLFKLNDEFKKLLEIHGYNPGDGLFSFNDKTEVEPKERLEMDLKLANIIPIDDDYFYETYNLPKPDNYDELIKQKQQEKEALLKADQNNSKGIKAVWDKFFS